MSNVADRLRLLQRQVGLRPASAPVESMLTLREQLRRLMTRRQRSRKVLEAPAGTKLSDGLYAVEQRQPCFGVRELELPWSEEGAIPRERFVCFDTETTGLAGGVGTKAFMIGTTQWCGAELVTRQLYLTALAGEAAMLDAFASALPTDAILVSYNGRSYDAPLLKGRYRMHRQSHPFDARTHLDLLHPTRRAYRGRWENCRLVTIERHLLGIDRGDDLPGAQAPAAWLAYLRGHESRSLGRVLDHNRSDLVTLATLLQHFATERPSDRVHEADNQRLEPVDDFQSSAASMNCS
jgi:uncharacterized protein YprB with RNaseH-like and TPR domain